MRKLKKKEGFNTTKNLLEIFHFNKNRGKASETLLAIALKCGITVKELKKVNG